MTLATTTITKRIPTEDPTAMATVFPLLAFPSCFFWLELASLSEDELLDSTDDAEGVMVEEDDDETIGGGGGGGG